MAKEAQGIIISVVEKRIFSAGRPPDRSTPPGYVPLPEIY
jgi:hypothetical protein